VGERRVDRVTFRVVDYNTTEIREIDSAEVADCVAFEGNDSPAWIMVTGLHETDKIGELLRSYEIHPLVQDDIVNTRQQPKVEDFLSYLFITAKQITTHNGENRIDLQHFSMILTSRVVITFQEAPGPVFEPILQRLRDGKGRLRSSGPDYLAWAVLDALMDNYLVALAEMEDETSTLDETLCADENGAVTMRHIHQLRTHTNHLYRAIRPIREVAISLQRSESPLLSPSLTPFIRDLYDHAWHAIETADHLRESVTAIREFFQANLAQRMNEVMKVLTGISTIFLPLSFIAGAYGMNFHIIPGADHPSGFLLMWGLFAVCGLGMLVYFRLRRWL
jgi:magnesium transporter